MSDKNVVQNDEKLTDHDYDGIRELDNALPRWWLNIFYACILFSAGYWYYYHMGGGGMSPREIFEEQQHQAEFAETAKPQTASFDPNEILNRSKDPKALESGRAIFVSKCVSCHGTDGGGVVGPNLTDDYWIHGGKPDQIAKTINDGVAAKGMPNWGAMMNHEDVETVAAYVVSLHGTHPAKPKAPEGTLEGSSGAAPESKKAQQ